jgi:hypothetical protein
MDPRLAHHNIGRAIALNLCRRGPDMLGEVAQSDGGGAVGLVDGWVAEQDRDTDGKDKREQPVLRSGGAVGLECPSDGM